MSNLMNTVEQNCDSADAPCSAIETILSPRVANLGGFSVRRLLPTAKRKMVGPWVFFDEMGPAEFPAGQGINVLPHPHIGIATVTYLFEGEILHRDSVGSYQPIRPGDINLMVAGSGITHSERERPEVTAMDHHLHGLQLWLALPESHEETEPAFHHYPDDDIPAIEINGVPVRVMIGSAYGVTSPVRQFSETLYLEATLEAGQTLILPEAPERAVYIASGALRAHGSELPPHSMTVFSSEPGVAITATEDARIAVIGGEPLGKRFIEWNFVSSSKARIDQARGDWRAGRFEKVVGDEEAFIPY
ncbi:MULTISPECIES: pirin family protein [unclassified Marinobacter]|uniref:pirin family protein n=1 Tax=unclassified Marinobacter TaxID=83889 RepID=UPI0019279E2C|nr:MULTISPECIES: pirin family protein [unclassified Marinobacter]MBL3824308.1 pirin family protein [Marinobacter sp. MC3]MBL3892600.1 pirin family protein [Marinobacter sp. MW3]